MIPRLKYFSVSVSCDVVVVARLLCLVYICSASKVAQNISNKPYFTLPSVYVNNYILSFFFFFQFNQFTSVGRSLVLGLQLCTAAILGGGAVVMNDQVLVEAVEVKDLFSPEQFCVVVIVMTAAMIAHDFKQYILYAIR